MNTKIFNEGEWKDINYLADGVILGKRTVAFIDILGFKSLIETEYLQDLANRYESVINDIQRLSKPKGTKNRLFNEHPEDMQYCKYYIFSDSIILISNGASDQEAFKTVVFAWRVLQQLIIYGLPARGAITFDDIYINPSRNIFIGKALTKAYELEQRQEWVGAVIHDDLIKNNVLIRALVENNNSFVSKLLLKYAVPMKNGESKDFFTLNWRANLLLEEGAKSLFKMTGDKMIDIKFENALEYCKSALCYSLDSNTPEELSFSWVGKSKPPFKDFDFQASSK